MMAQRIDPLPLYFFNGCPLSSYSHLLTKAEPFILSQPPHMTDLERRSHRQRKTHPSSSYSFPLWSCIQGAMAGPIKHIQKYQGFLKLVTKSRRQMAS